MITFVVAVNNDEILKKNLLGSPCLTGSAPHEIIIQRNFPSAARAYNDALGRAKNDLIVFIHQDVFLPHGWLETVEGSLQFLEREDPDWSVLGCFGVAHDGAHKGYVFTSGWKIVGERLSAPARVRTLDEIVLVMRRSSGLRFDDALPHFHFYGADICMSAETRGMNCYVIPAFCIHNTDQILYMPKEFYRAYHYLRRKWKDRLPIDTSCIRVARSGWPVYDRKLRELYNRLRKRSPAPRYPNPQDILKEAGTSIKL